MADNYMTFNDAVEVLTPYAEKINTIKPESITWAAYQLLTSEQKAAKRYLITDYPSPTGYVNKLSDLEDVSINSQTLSNGQVPVYNSTNEVWENKTILENSLTSTATDVALTAAQGKVLQDTKQAKNLTTPLTINGTQETTVEGALGGLNDYGDALTDNLAANENVYGAKNLIPYPYEDGASKTGNGITFTANSDGSVTASGIALANTDFNLGYKDFGNADMSSKPNDSTANGYVISTGVASDSGTTHFLQYQGNNHHIYFVIVAGADLSTPITFYPMIRDARILDPTYVPPAKTNLQLTNDKAERSDLATIRATGSTNTTGATITSGTFFYLNGTFCKATADIAVNATFTLNTNYKENTVGAEIKAVENKDTSSFSVSTESGVSLQKAICRNGFVYLQLYFAALANSTKIATITDANYLPEGGAAIGLIEPNLSAEKINYTYGSFSGSNVYVYVSGSPTSGGIITFVYPVTGY